MSGAFSEADPRMHQFMRDAGATDSRCRRLYDHGWMSSFVTTLRTFASSCAIHERLPAKKMAKDVKLGATYTEGRAADTSFSTKAMSDSHKAILWRQARDPSLRVRAPEVLEIFVKNVPRKVFRMLPVAIFTGLVIPILQDKCASLEVRLALGQVRQQEIEAQKREPRGRREPRQMQDSKYLLALARKESGEIEVAMYYLKCDALKRLRAEQHRKLKQFGFIDGKSSSKVINEAMLRFDASGDRDAVFGEFRAEQIAMTGAHLLSFEDLYGDEAAASATAEQFAS